MSTAEQGRTILKVFAAALAASDPVPHCPQQLTAAHVEAFRDHLQGRSAQRDYVKRLRRLLRDDPELPFGESQ